MQHSASLRLLWTAVVPVASGSLPRTEGSLKLLFPLQRSAFPECRLWASLPSSRGSTSPSRLFAMCPTRKRGLCKSTSPRWPLMSPCSKQGLSVQNGIYCRLKKSSRKRKKGERAQHVYLEVLNMRNDSNLLQISKPNSQNKGAGWLSKKTVEKEPSKEKPFITACSSRQRVFQASAPASWSMWVDLFC